MCGECGGALLIIAPADGFLVSGAPLVLFDVAEAVDVEEVDGWGVWWTEAVEVGEGSVGSVFVDEEGVPSPTLDV